MTDTNVPWHFVSLGVSTQQFTSLCGLIDYKSACADPLVFERGLARERAEPSCFEGGSAHPLIQIIDLEIDITVLVLTPWMVTLLPPAIYWFFLPS